ncbi:MAG: DUF4838 domain-containing protein [Phycisphaeraceae bacterium]
MMNALWLVGITLMVTAPALAAGQPGAVTLEDHAAQSWRGAPVPRAGNYQPPAGKPRPAVVFTVGRGVPSKWTRPLKVDLASAKAIAFRAHADHRVKAALAFTTPKGSFTREFSLAPGEQIVVLSTVSFAQSADVGGWNEVNGATLTLTPSDAGATVTLIGIEAMEQEDPVVRGEVMMYHPTSGVTDTAVAYPLYAIIDSATPGPKGWIGKALAGHLETMTGVKLPVNPQGLEAAELSNVILLGRDAALAAGAATDKELEPWSYSGFVIKADSPTVTIASKSFHGVAYGIYRFLEKQGCRFYGVASADVIPKLDAPLLQTFELSDKPVIFFGSPGSYATRGGTFALMGDPGKTVPKGFLDSGWLDHTAAFLVPKSIYYDQHPEYYSLLSEGKRLAKTTPDVRLMLCLSNPDVLRISAQRALEWIEAQPDRHTYCITQADGADWCNCEACAKLGNRADQTLHWVNHVARAVGRKHPDKLLMTFAYNGAEAPPTRVIPEKNVVVCYAAWPNATSAPNSLGNYDHPANEVAYQQIKGWMKIAPGQIGIYDYNAAGRMTLYSMADRIKWMARHDMGAVWYCGINKMWEDLFKFVHGRLCWDPHEDVGRLKNEYIRAVYGQAAPVVTELFDGMYDRLMLDGYQGVWPPGSYYGYEFVDRAYALFDRALELTGGKPGHDELLQSRSLFVQNSLGLNPGFNRQLTDDQYKAFSRNLREYVEKVWQPDYQKKLAAFEAGKAKTAPTIKGLADRVSELCYVDIGEAPAEGQLPLRLVELMNNPKETVARYRQNYFVQKTDTGWVIPGIQFRGGKNFGGYSWMCPPRKDTVAVYGALTDVSRCQARLVLEQSPPTGALVLKIEGQDSEKAWAPPPRMQIWVNDRKIFDGANEFPKKDWAWKEYAVPAGALIKGENAIEIRNLAGTDNLTAYWIMLNEVRIESAGN